MLGCLVRLGVTAALELKQEVSGTYLFTLKYIID